MRKNLLIGLAAAAVTTVVAPLVAMACGGPSIAYVFDPPSNIRVKPNGRILCKVTRRAYIDIYSYNNGWYTTDYCNGRTGYIHESQVYTP